MGMRGTSGGGVEGVEKERVKVLVMQCRRGTRQANSPKGQAKDIY